ncbi:hypothetical protein [Nitrosomonas communis]|uniref:hypothetical protein n=1 Tax=Nitrosomonas communis TaxID=44574 RepID=UPI0034E952F8
MICCVDSTNQVIIAGVGGIAYVVIMVIATMVITVGIMIVVFSLVIVIIVFITMEVVGMGRIDHVSSIAIKNVGDISCSIVVTTP